MRMQAPAITIAEISIIIPVKNNQQGIENTLESFFATQTQDALPREIIIVDNNSSVPLQIPLKFQNRGIEIKPFECKRLGPAAARNVGVQHALGSWILFVDSDCVFTTETITGYLKAKEGAIAYAGYTDAIAKDSLSQYYISQEIHLPVRIENPDGSITPKYLVTANALVYKPAIEKIGRFNEWFIYAGGEDIDLGFRLLEIGRMEYALDSVIMHDFDDGVKGFYKRFKRYGKGNRILQEIYQMSFFPRCRPKENKVIINHFYSFLQLFSMMVGYFQMFYHFYFTKEGSELFDNITALKEEKKRSGRKPNPFC